MGMANEWLDKAKSFLPNSGPVEAGAAYIAERRVERINIRNWQRKLSPKLDTEEEWLVYVTGGNKSCFGRCGHADATWNVSFADCPSSVPDIILIVLSLSAFDSFVCPNPSRFAQTSASGYAQL